MEQIPTSVKTLQILYIALISGIVFFIAASFFVVKTSGAIIDDSQQQNTMQIIAVLSTLTIPIGLFLFKKKLLETNNKHIHEKMEIYRSAMILRAALMEGSAFFCIVSYMITGNIRMIILTALILAIMIFIFPTRPRIAGDLGISETDLE
ncbi:MAG: hypothetical protein IPH45_05910 [Bacteroidales bacterium]|nr:hypothetical protein [Bacteroidales bacterium]